VGRIERLIGALERATDIRRSEWRLTVPAFATLFLIIASHTILETARDALFLGRLPVRALGGTYLILAAATLPAGVATARIATLFGPRRGLMLSLLLAVTFIAALYRIADRPSSVVTLYVATGVFASVLVPQFWGWVDARLTVTEGRRLLAPIAGAGVIGAVAGAAVASRVVASHPVKALILVAGIGFLLAALLLSAGGSRPQRAASNTKAPVRLSLGETLRREPFLWRIVLIAVLSTATVLPLDYLFKWTVARTIAPAALGDFFARYYAAVNGAALVVQLFVARRLVRRLGVAAATAVTPMLLLLGGAGALVLVSGAVAVMLVRALDGSLRHSMTRVTTELMYLPIEAPLRDRAKPFIDGSLTRVVQAASAIALLVAAELDLITFARLVVAVLVLCAAWLAAAVTLRDPYLGLFRRALQTGAMPQAPVDHPLDLTTAELLIERLASADAAEVIAAMATLARHGRERLIPALILYHPHESVLLHALGLWSASPRADWIPLAEPLLTDSRQAVRLATVRALATHGRLDLVRRLASDPDARVRGYVAAYLELRDSDLALAQAPTIAALLGSSDVETQRGRLGLLAAIADCQRDPRLDELLILLAAHQPVGEEAREWNELLARAAIVHGDRRLIPPLVARLHERSGRESIRAALVALGDDALRTIELALADPGREHRLHIHLPQTIARFNSQRAANVLLRALQDHKSGLVRYKAVRGLGQIAARASVHISRRRIRALVHENLVRHLRMLGWRERLLTASAADEANAAVPTGRLLVGLLDDKLRQSLERAFRLLRIAHPREDFHRVELAVLSSESRARANAAEFIDALLNRGALRTLRELMAIALDDAPALERVARAAPLVGAIAATPEAVLAELIADHDVQLAGIALEHATLVGTEATRRNAEQARAARPELGQAASRLLGAGARPRSSHG
jgi:ATP:ADP antiporter, AAA family